MSDHLGPDAPRSAPFSAFADLAARISAKAAVGLGLIAATSVAIAVAASPWLVPPYLGLMAWLLAAPGKPAEPEAPDRSNPPDCPTETAIPSAIEQAAEFEPEPSPELPPPPRKPRKSRGKGRAKAIPAASAEKPQATWVQVEPGKFVRVEIAPGSPVEADSESSESTNPVSESSSEAEDAAITSPDSVEEENPPEVEAIAPSSSPQDPASTEVRAASDPGPEAENAATPETVERSAPDSDDGNRDEIPLEIADASPSGNRDEHEEADGPSPQPITLDPPLPVASESPSPRWPGPTIGPVRRDRAIRGAGPRRRGISRTRSAANRPGPRRAIAAPRASRGRAPPRPRRRFLFSLGIGAARELGRGTPRLVLSYRGGDSGPSITNRRIKSGNSAENRLRGITGSQPASRAASSAATSTWEPKARNRVSGAIVR